MRLRSVGPVLGALLMLVATGARGQVRTRFNGGTISNWIGLGQYTTTQRNALSGLRAGSVIWNTTTGDVEYWDGTAWQVFSGTATISGTANRVAMFTGTNSLGNSSLTDNGTTVATTEAASVGALTATAMTNSALTNGNSLIKNTSSGLIAESSLSDDGMTVATGEMIRSQVALAHPTAFLNNDAGQVQINEPSVSLGNFAKLTFAGAGDFSADAAIGAQFTNNGSVLHFGTSNSYPGVTTDAMQLDYEGNGTLAGDWTVSGGTQPASSSGNGTAASAALSVTGVAGGNTTGTTGQTAGKGGGVTITAGNGGTAPSGSINGAGGDITLTPGAAGAGAGTAASAGKVIVGGAGLNVNSPGKTDGLLNVGSANDVVGQEWSVSSSQYAKELFVGGFNEFLLETSGSAMEFIASGVTSSEPATIFFSGGQNNLSKPTMLIQGETSQTGDVLDFENGSGTEVAGIAVTGDATTRRLLSSGTALVTGDVALSAGWGTTATAAVTGTDSAGTITVTSAGTGQAANPTITLTFHDGAWAAAPVSVANWNTGGTGTGLNPFVSDTTTTMVLTYPGTPAAASTYKFNFVTRG